MKNTSFLASLAGLAIVTIPLGLSAQEDPGDAPPPLSDVWVMVVKPGMNAEFDAAMAAHIRFRKNAGESRDWNAYRVAVGHNMKPIAFRSCCFDWADLDAHEAESDELGLVEHFGENVGQYVDHFHHYLEKSDWKNSHWPDEGTSGPYFGVTTWTVNQGSGPSASAAKDKMSQLALNEGWAKDDNNWLWFSREVGNAEITLVSSFENFADMAPDEQTFFEFAAENLGDEEAAAMFSDFGSGFEQSEYAIWKLDESLSTPRDDEEE